MTDEQKGELYEKLCELNGETVLRLFTDYHGMYLLDYGFAQHCVDEGVLELDFIDE